MTETDAPRIFGGGTMRGLEVRPLTSDQRSTFDLVDLGEAGYRIFGQRDLDHRFRPWLVAKEDGSIWTLEHGIPAAGVRPTSHAVLMDDPHNWAYLVSAQHSGRADAPASVAELEARAAKAKEDARRQADERERRLRELRKAATPVTSGDVDPKLKRTLAQAVERIDRAGGRVEVDHGRLVVFLPPSAGTFGSDPLDAAKLLYLAEGAVVAALTSGEALPDKLVTPSGAVLR
jgi:hypothetical protein